MGDDDICVRVAVRIRPQIPREIIDLCRICTTVTPGEPQVTLGSDKSFTYDYVFDTNDTQDNIYETCVENLVDGSLDGYNATVLAYGQTGSGKTYTMGTGFDVEIPDEQIGIIPRAIRHLFEGIKNRTEAAKERGEIPPEFKIVAQFMELYNEEVIDLFDPIKDSYGRKNIKIHEDPNGSINVAGVAMKPVLSTEDALQCLRIGALSRTTASTQMNSQSSRSHAIFTLHIKQQRMVKFNDTDTGEPSNEFETLTAKFHFVDLAGSERLKRTGATGERAKEGISINCGLLALGNVISALGDKSKKALHVPYRDSKLTRLLQDSLGGNSQTVMIACVSPSDRDFMETLNTLKYANRARNIKNKIVVNQDKSSRTIVLLREEISRLQLELLEFKQGKRIVGDDGKESINDMYHENTMLQAEMNNLRTRIKAMQETIDALSVKNTELLTEKAAGVWLNSGSDSDVTEMVQSYIKEIEELRAKLMESDFTVQNLKKTMKTQTIKSLNNSSVYESSFMDTAAVIEQAKKELEKEKERLNLVKKENDGDGANEDDKGDEMEDDSSDEKDNDEGSGSDTDTDDRAEEQLGTELADLTEDINLKQKLIEELELSQKRLQTMKQHYEDKLLQLQARIRDTQNERDKVLSSFTGHSSEPVEKVKKVKDEYEKKLINMQKELKLLQAAKKEHARLLRNQTQHENQLRSLKTDLADMKRLKVKLINQMKDESARHKEAESKRIREIAQLRKESRKNANTIRSMEAERKLKEQVLKRKQEEVLALRKVNRGKLSNKAAGKLNFSPKIAKQKWQTIEKNINKVVINKQVLASQERDMDRLLERREALTRELERLKQRKSSTYLTHHELSELDNEIDNVKSEINYVQENIQEAQHSIMQIEESKDNTDNYGILPLSQSINTVSEARYLIEKLFNMALTQSYTAAQQEIRIQENEAKLHQIKQDNAVQQQLLEHMIANSSTLAVSMTASTSSNANESEPSSNNSSRSSSPVDNQSLHLENKESKSNKARRRTALPQELLYGNGMSQSQDPDMLRHMMEQPIVRVPSAPGSLKGLIPFRQLTQTELRPSRQLTQTDMLKPSPILTRKLSDKQDITSPRLVRRLPTSVTPAKHGSMEQGLDGAGAGTDGSTTPGSPPAFRRAISREENVFSRLTASTVVPANTQTLQRGIITKHSGKMIAKAPLQCISIAEGHTSAVLSVCATDELMFTGAADRTVKVWDLQTGTERETLCGHPNNVVAVRYDSLSGLVLSASAAYVKMWDLRVSSTRCIKVLCSSGTLQSGSYLNIPALTRSVQISPGESQINDVMFNNSGTCIYTAASDSKVRIWDLRRLSCIGKLTGGHQAAVMCLAVKSWPGGNDLVVTGSKDHYVKAFEVTPQYCSTVTPTVNFEPPHYDGIQSLALGNGVLFSGSRDMAIKKWEFKHQYPEFKVQSVVNAHKSWICGLALLRNDTLLLSGCRSGYIKLWDIEAGFEELSEMKGHNSSINAVTTNSTHIFTASNDSLVKIWKLKQVYAT